MSDERLLISIKNLSKYFDLRGSFLETYLSRKPRYLRAVDDVSLDISRGEIIGLTGESGCGKTTTGRLLMRLLEPTKGEVYFEGQNLYSMNRKKEIKEMRRKIQMIFQDPYEYLSPRLTIREALAEPLRIHNMIDCKESELSKIEEMLELVDLTPARSFLLKYPHEISGGQRQRVVVARALMLNPLFLVADEPVSMLDVSIRFGILNLLLDMNRWYGLAILFITHDLAIARYLCERIAVMYLGKIVELGPTDQVIDTPAHPYTRALVSSVPIPDPDRKGTPIVIDGTAQAPVDSFLGCRFYPRCPYRKDACREKEPELREIEDKHFAACHVEHVR